MGNERLPGPFEQSDEDIMPRNSARIHELPLGDSIGQDDKIGEEILSQDQLKTEGQPFA